MQRDIQTPPTLADAILDSEHPIKQRAIDWAQTTLPRPGEKPVGWVVDRGLWRDAAEFGIQGLFAPTKFGGSDASAIEAALTFEGIGAAGIDNGVAFALAAQTVALQRALVGSGTPEQLERWVPGLVSGEYFGSFAMSETSAGSDTWAIQTTANQLGDGSFVLNGGKAWVTLGPICDMAIIFASTDPTLGRWGISAFIVDPSNAGFVRGPSIEKMGLKASPFGSFSFDDCHIPASALLGPVGAGGAIFMAVVEVERALLYMTQIGAMENLLDRSIGRARTRRQSGAHIGSFQAVSHRIADMKLRLESSRLLLYKAAALFDAGKSMSMAASLAKLATAQLSAQSSFDAMQIFGAEGYTEAAGVEVDLRDALAGLSFSGTPDITRNAVAALLGVTRAEPEESTQ